MAGSESVSAVSEHVIDAMIAGPAIQTCRQSKTTITGAVVDPGRALQTLS